MSNSGPPPDDAAFRNRAYRRLLHLTGRLHPHGLFQIEQVREKMIALTIDDGPSARTAEILSLLQRYDCRATFFVHTSHLERVPGARPLAAHMLETGHELANHMPEDRTSFLLSPGEFASEFVRSHEALAALGSTPRFFRASRGLFHANHMLPILKQLNYYERFIMASYLPWDVFLPLPKTYARQLTSGAFPGAIFVLHDRDLPGQRPGGGAIETLSHLLPALANRGFRLEPLGRVLARAA